MVEVTGIAGVGNALSALRTGTANQERNEVVRRSATTQVSAATARLVIGAADSAADSVLTTLRSLENIAIQASSFGRLVGNDFARETYQAQVERLLLEIDRIVESAAVNDINILSSDSTSNGFNTTALGGLFVVTPKPIDIAGLNLTGLRTVFDNEISAALTRLENAITIAAQRRDQINGLSLVFSNGDTFLNHLTGTADPPPPGTQVNILT